MQSAKLANIHGFISSLPYKYDSVVGEHGNYLSGGQKQRIGIARAFYSDSSLLVLDEATSALDVDTERNIITSISHLNPSITIIMIAHRLSTLKMCKRIIKVENGQLLPVALADIEFDS